MKKTFKDFWTHDMKQFYDESWGQENFDHTKVQAIMPGEQKKWKVIPSDQNDCLYKKKEAYDSCKMRSSKCEICGFDLRNIINCPNGICSTCQSVLGYHTTNCSKCNCIIRSLKCNICNRTGHELKTCPDLWRRYHQTTTYSKELSKSRASQKSKNMLWCCNCAKQGHTADTCTYSKSTGILSNKIFSYEATYNNVVDEFQLELSSFLNYMQTKKESETESSPYDTNLISIPQTPQPSGESSSSCTKHKKRRKKAFDQPTNKMLKKYEDILISLKNKCKTSDIHSLGKINRYLNDIQNKHISKNKIRNIMKLKKELTHK